jgi:hypothetical protein
MKPLLCEGFFYVGILEIYFSFYKIVGFYFTDYRRIRNIFPKHDPTILKRPL